MHVLQRENSRKVRRHIGSVMHHGTSASELAIVLPLLLTLCLLSVDLGRFAHDYLAVSNAARAGADYGATHHRTEFTAATWDSNVAEAVTRELESLPGFDAGQLDVEVENEESSDNLDIVTVRVRYPFETAVAWPSVSRPLWLERTVVMRRFR